MKPEVSGRRPIDDDYATDEEYSVQEASPEEQAARCVDAIWSAHAEEMERAMRKLTEGA
jgi:hypothetical protein